MSISTKKVLIVELSFKEFSKLNIAKVFEDFSVPDRFQKYKPVYMLEGYVDAGGVFHSVQRKTTHYLPEGVSAVRFLLLTQHDTESVVARNIADFSLQQLQKLEDESRKQTGNVGSVSKVNL